MKKVFYTLTCLAITGALTACGGGNKKAAETTAEEAPTTQMLSYSKSMKAAEKLGANAVLGVCFDLRDSNKPVLMGTAVVLEDLE